MEKMIDNVPVIIEYEMFIFPFMIAPIFISDKVNVVAVEKALENEELVFVVCAKNTAQDNEMPFYDVGVIGKIMRKVVLPDGRIKLLFQGMSKGRIVQIHDSESLEAKVEIVTYRPSDQEKTQAMLGVLTEKVNMLAHVSQTISPELLKTMEGYTDANKTVDLILSSLRFKKEQNYKIFSSDDTEERLLLLTQLVMEEIETQKLQKEIKSKVHDKMDQINKEYFLREQLKQIQKELGIDKQKDEEIEMWLKKLNSIKQFINESAYKEVRKQIERLSRMHQDSSDANILQNYVEWVLEIPFDKFSSKKLSIKSVEKQLGKDHYSLEEPKQRIVEYFAVKQLLEQRGMESSSCPNEDGEESRSEVSTISSKPKDTKVDSQNRAKKEGKGAILCFYGPPGVGKTSLANSIALAIDRPLVRVALGGLEDVNELRGHRRTYLGAMPGRIIQGLIDAKKMNPVVVLDEIDKVMRGLRGDPTSVLLEILDPEQNTNFRDYYVNFSVDLSQVVFIATANDVSAIPGPLRDRMEFIQISSYTPQEKFEIARKYLIPQEMRNHALRNGEIKINKDAIELIIQNYTREAGVRNLRKNIATIMRKTAKKILDGNIKSVSITPKNIPEFLKKSIFEIQKTDIKPRVGVVNGLAWTKVGGDVLRIEAIKLVGKGNLKLTGSLGDVMKESAHIAYSVVKSKFFGNYEESLSDDDDKRDEKSFDLEKIEVKKRRVSKQNEDKSSNPDSKNLQFDIHLHVPEGATPKDGPSAGITMACAIASILLNKKARQDVAMTGELTLSGDVLPIGGLKEKLIAAHKSGITEVLIPTRNYERDLDDIPDEVKNEVNITKVKDIETVFSVVFDCK